MRHTIFDLTIATAYTKHSVYEENCNFDPLKFILEESFKL